VVVGSTGIGRVDKFDGVARLTSRSTCRVALAISALFLILGPTPALAQAGGADRVRISGLSDVPFGTISNFSTDYVRTQSVCLYAKAPPANHYRITATGSGNGGQFNLSSGGNTLPYQVAWSNAPGQSSGALFSPNIPLGGLPNSARNDNCSNGPATTASLIVTVKSSDLASAIAGIYSGSLTLLIAPE